jgi:voltage-gated potassium channel
MLTLFLPHRLRARLAQEPAFAKFLNLIVLFLVSCAAFLISFRLTESVGWGEAGWQVWQTVTTVGYGNHPAETPAGRISTGVFGLAGIAFLGAVISAYFDWRADAKERKRYGQMENPYKNGYIVINFPGVSKFTVFASELAIAEPNVRICVVDDLIEELPVSVTHIPKTQVHFVKGSLLREETYQKAGVAEAKSIIVFPQHTGVVESDATTRMIVEIVSRLAPSDTRLTHVLVSPENEWLFKGERSTAIYEIEEVLILVQECHDPHSAAMIQSLLRNSRGANPKTVNPQRIVGWTWGQFLRACLAASEERGIPVNPLALMKEGRPDPCPVLSTVIEKGDCLSLIVPNDFHWERFEEALAAYDATRPKAAA